MGGGGGVCGQGAESQTNHGRVSPEAEGGGDMLADSPVKFCGSQQQQIPASSGFLGGGGLAPYAQVPLGA